MKLTDLEPQFVRYEVRACSPGPNCSVVSPHTEHEYHVGVDTIAEADGVCFLCPKCFATNSGPIGTHSIVCWRPRVPPHVYPKPGRWELTGTSLDDLTLVVGSSSVSITEECNAHFFIEQGNVRMC